MWILILVMCFIVVGLSIAFPSGGQAFSGFTTEIIGTYVGFMLAISFTEMMKAIDHRNQAKRLKTNLLDEVNTIVFMLRDNVTVVPIDIWEMGLSTGDYGQLDEETQRKFWAFYNGVRVLKAETVEYLAMERRGSPKRQIEEVITGIATARAMIVEQGLEMLVEHGVPIYSKSAKE